MCWQLAGSFQTAIIKTHFVHSLNEIVKETIKMPEGKWKDCRQGVVNTRQSGVFAILFVMCFYSNITGSVRLSHCSSGAGESFGKCTSLFYEW